MVRTEGRNNEMRETCMANDSYTYEKKEGYLIQASSSEANKIKM